MLQKQLQSYSTIHSNTHTFYATFSPRNSFMILFSAWVLLGAEQLPYMPIIKIRQCKYFSVSRGLYYNTFLVVS